MRTRDWTLGALGVMGLWALGAGVTPAYGASNRGQAGPRTALELEGRQAGRVKSATGGDPVSPGHYSDMTLEAGLGMSRPFFDWVTTAVNGTQVRHHGAVVTLDYNNHAQSELKFTDALISEVDLPKFVSSDKDAAFLTVKIAPGTAAHASASGTWPAYAPAIAKKWMTSSFRLAITGLPCGGAEIDPIAIRPSSAGSRGVVRGERRGTAVDISLSVPAANAGPWQAWANTFIGQGKNGPENKRSGQLTVLGQDMQTVLFVVSFTGIGITHLTSGPRTAIALHAETVTFRRENL